MQCYKEDKDIGCSFSNDCPVRAGARIEDSHHSCWSTRAPLQLVDQVVDGESLDGELVAIGQVLNSPHICLAQDLVGGEGAGLSLRETKDLTFQRYINVKADT